LRRFAPFLALLIAVSAWAQVRPPQRAPKAEELGQLDSSEALFTVMAALTAGGYNLDADTPTNHKIRKALRDHFAAQKLPSVDALRRYVRDHKPKNPALELNQYISYTLLVTGPPNFGWREPNLPPPPDVAAIDDFTPLLIQFYQEAKVADLWKQLRPDYDREIDKYHAPVSQAVLQANAYLRNPTNGYQGKHFQVLIDLLAAPRQVHERHFLDDDTILLTRHPDDELPIAQIRHAYLRHLIDPYAFKFAADLKKKAALLDYSLGSPILEAHYKADFGLLATECLIKAIEAKLDRKPALVDQALREGFVVTPAFYELLTAYEKQEQSMRLYFPELIGGIDLKKEERRLDHVDFISERESRTIRTTRTVEDRPQLTGALKTLDEAEELIRSRDAAKAKEAFLRVLQETAEKPLHARAYYGLARAALLEKDPETGDRLFRKALDLDPDPPTKSWCLLYLGKLADSQGEKDDAQEQYKAAVAVPGLPDQVRREAEQGLRGAFARR
jgi:tetratricopeptide (TPR) repeat protein